MANRLQMAAAHCQVKPKALFPRDDSFNLAWLVELKPISWRNRLSITRATRPVAKPMNEDQRIEPPLTPSKVDHQQQVNVIGHNHEVTRRQSRAKRVKFQPKRHHPLTQRRRHATRQHPPLRRTYATRGFGACPRSSCVSSTTSASIFFRPATASVMKKNCRPF